MRHILSLRRHQEAKVVGIFLLAVVLVSGMSSYPAAADTVPVHILRVDGVILPEMVDYFDAGIKKAEEANAAVCIIELNTPGGLLEASGQIVSRIMGADVPIVVYVSPVGAWAAGAGTYITLAAHLAVMAPGTIMGCARPDTNGLTVELYAEWMETIAEERGRDIEQARLAVTQCKSFSDTEALEYNLIDLRSQNLADLISQINGWQVLVSGEEVTIDTTDYVLVKHRSFRKPVNWAVIGGIIAGAVAVAGGLSVLLLRRRRTSAA